MSGLVVQNWFVAGFGVGSWSFFVSEIGFCSTRYRQCLRCCCIEGLLVHCLSGHCRVLPLSKSFFVLECTGYVVVS